MGGRNSSKSELTDLAAIQRGYSAIRSWTDQLGMGTGSLDTFGIREAALNGLIEDQTAANDDWAG